MNAGFEFAGQKTRLSRDRLLLIMSILGAACAIAVDQIASGNEAAVRRLGGWLADATGQPERAALLVAGFAFGGLGAVGFAYFKPLSLKGAFGGGFVMVAVAAIFIA